MASGKRSSAGERVLEGRHVIGLFFLMLLFSGVFFTLGFVMGKNQLEGQVRAATTRAAETSLPLKPEPSARHGKTNVSTPGPSDNSNSESESNPAPPTPDWEFYHAGEKNSANDHLRSSPAQSDATKAKAVATSAKSPVPAAPKAIASSSNASHGSYYLQVAALRNENDAVSLANDLHRKKILAFVQPPLGDKYYRVQVGPYSDLKSAESAKTGLEAAGFKAIIKH